MEAAEIPECSVFVRNRNLQQAGTGLKATTLGSIIPQSYLRLGAMIMKDIAAISFLASFGWNLELSRNDGSEIDESNLMETIGKSKSGKKSEKLQVEVKGRNDESVAKWP